MDVLRVNDTVNVIQRGSVKSSRTGRNVGLKNMPRSYVRLITRENYLGKLAQGGCLVSMA